LGRWNNLPSDVILTSRHLPPGLAIGKDQWKNSRIEIEQKKSSHLLSDLELHLDGESGSCLTFVPDDQPDQRRIDCDFPIHGLSVGYIGPKDDSHVLDLIVANITAIR
jgi:hypothetical protein